MAILFTYDDPLRPALGQVWPGAMTAALRCLDGAAVQEDDHFWRGYAIASLLPVPQIEMSDLDIDATFARVRAAWIAPESITDLVHRWIQAAHGEPKALVSMTEFAKWGRTSAQPAAPRITA
ncbi:hypothetical protein [Glycomyces dulcitolivorans]|uniref:hypothetical protein n=1 Tax=Glycomyces dulcitolivorans TaxID=2200759 RepID=UPI000DD45351|nr:hypothetical protein [Glycomyces dulcitolivorans]